MCAGVAAGQRVQRRHTRALGACMSCFFGAAATAQPACTHKSITLHTCILQPHADVAALHLHAVLHASSCPPARHAHP